MGTQVDNQNPATARFERHILGTLPPIVKHLDFLTPGI